MKIWAEEKESGTWEILFTLPFNEWEVVLAKYIASCMNVLIALLSTIFIPFTVMIFGQPDLGIVFSGYLGVFLVAITFVSIVMYFSLFFQTQIGAFLFGFFALSVFYSPFVQKSIDFIGKTASDWIGIFSLQKHFEAFRLGILDPRDLYFYLSINIVFLSLTVIHLKDKR